MKNIFVPLDGTQSELPHSIYRTNLSLFAVELLISYRKSYRNP